jgi:hypothetical protein
MTTQHTPGPWTYEFQDEDTQLKITSGEEIVLGGCGCCGSPWCSNEDAKLICAAPDLLDALKMAVSETLEYIKLNNLTGAENNHWIVQAKAAIAKATGI